MHSSDDSVLLQRTPKSHSSKAVSKAAMRATLNGRITGLSFEKLPPSRAAASPAKTLATPSSGSSSVAVVGAGEAWEVEEGAAHEGQGDEGEES